MVEAMNSSTAPNRLEKGVISSSQLGLLFFLSILTTGILTAPSPIYSVAYRDIWISSLIGSLPAYGIILIVHALHRKYPGMTFIEYSTKVYGKVIGKIIGLLFLLFTLHTTGVVVRQFSEFMAVGFFPRTPLIVLAAVIIFTSACAVRGGVEIIGRFPQLFTPIVLVLLMFIIVPLIPDFNVKELLPVMENGPLPPIKGALILQQWFLLYSVTSFYLPYVADGKRSLRWSLYSLTALVIVMLIGHVCTVMVLGEVTAQYNFSFMNLSRYIQIAGFFEHLQSIVMAIWVFSLFVRLSTTYYILALGTAQWLNLSDYRMLVMPIGILIVVFSLWSLPSIASYSSAIAPNTFYYIIMLGGVPLLTWLVSSIRHGIGTKN
ncbi:spore gernimation protein [Paenibacillaceae bacterium]|nr:spore gernimation protein [Paenibacillaceae bacterium]